ncbi:MAG: gliding motility-associated C-terminal domain-containing protein [Bacteroidota bacterium]
MGVSLTDDGQLVILSREQGQLSPTQLQVLLTVDRQSGDLERALAPVFPSHAFRLSDIEAMPGGGVLLAGSSIFFDQSGVGQSERAVLMRLDNNLEFPCGQQDFIDNYFAFDFSGELQPTTISQIDDIENAFQTTQQASIGFSSRSICPLESELVLEDISCEDDIQTYTFVVDPPVPDAQWGIPPTLSPVGTPDGAGIVLSGEPDGTETLTLTYENPVGDKVTTSFSNFRDAFFTVEILGDNVEVSCEIQEVGLQGLVTAGVLQSPYDFIWRDTLTNDSVSLQASNTYRANTADDNQIFLTVRDDRGCTARDSTSLEAPRRVPEDFAPADTSICEGDEISISLPAFLVDDPEVDIRWADGTPTRTRTLSALGSYAIEAESECGVGEESFELSYVPPLPPLEGPPDMTFCPRNPEATRLPDTTLAQIESWQWPDSSSDSFYTPPDVGTYSVQLFGQCETQTRQFTVTDTVQSFYIPNAFSPNGDLLNDVFVVGGGVALEYLHIYNRWGQRIATPEPPERGWDGNGQPEGAYVYELKFEENRCVNQLDRHRTGTVTLIR